MFRKQYFFYIVIQLRNRFYIWNYCWPRVTIWRRDGLYFSFSLMGLQILEVYNYGFISGVTYLTTTMSCVLATCKRFSRKTKEAGRKVVYYRFAKDKALCKDELTKCKREDSVYCLFSPNYYEDDMKNKLYYNCIRNVNSKNQLHLL